MEGNTKKLDAKAKDQQFHERVVQKEKNNIVSAKVQDEATITL